MRATLCPSRPSVQHIPKLRAHVEFPVDYAASLKRSCGTIRWELVTRPPGFQIDEAGGRFYRTAVRTGTETVTIRVTQDNGGVVGSSIKRFRAVVDDNTVTYPVFRDYLSQTTTVPIMGRAHGATFGSFRFLWSRVRRSGDADRSPADRRPDRWRPRSPTRATAEWWQCGTCGERTRTSTTRGRCSATTCGTRVSTPSRRRTVRRS